MHNVYQSKGSFDVAYQLPIIIYSSFISMFFGALVQMLGLSNDSIVDFKQDKETNDLSYDLALKNDKRTYWQYYISLIRTKHEILYTFFYN